MKVGIIGGGQLALMLSQSAKKLGLVPLCLCGEFEPAARVSAFTDDPKVLFSLCEVVTIENEFLNPDVILDKEKVIPNLSAVNLFRNKLSQKRLLEELSISTSPYIIFSESEDPQDFIGRAKQMFNDNFVMKWSLFGYDGKGTLICSDGKNEDLATSFIRMGMDKGAEIYIEKLIPFKKEVSLVSAFSNQSSFYLPVVETVQKDGVCHRVWSISDFKYELNAQDAAEKLARKTGLKGVFAIEFFETQEGLLVNEIAPRVHNSGHWSQTFECSQFELHWLGLLNRDFPKRQYPSFFGMLNLLGLQKEIKELEVVNFENLNENNIFMQWYGKREIRPGRKLGHINFFSENRNDFDILIKKVNMIEQSIWNNIYNTNPRK